MVASGRQGPWHPRGQGLLVAVVALSVVALMGHGLVALTLLRGTVHPLSSAGSAGGGRATAPPVTAPTTTPSPTSGSASGAPGTNSTASPRRLDHACLVVDNPPTTARIPGADPFGPLDLGTGAELQRLYSVTDRDLTPIDGAGPVRECDRQLWAMVVGSTTSEQRGWLKEFLVFDSDVTSSGGPVGILSPKADNDPGEWRLSLAPNDSTDLDVALEVAHELGHLFSLNPGQLATPPPASCSTIDAGHGCLDQNAYLVQFLSSTWSQAEIDEYASAAGLPEGSERDQALDAFYDRHHASFVSSYAATDPVEDFAETFSLWCAFGPDNPVLSDYIEGDPTDGSAKLDWFEHGPSTVKSTYQSSCAPLRELTR